MAGDLSTHHAQLFTNRRAAHAIPREMFSRLLQRKRQRRAPTHCRSNPAMLRQHKLNGHMVFAEGPSNLMQGLPPPSSAISFPLLLRKLEPLPKCHKHHLIEKSISDGVASTG